MCQHHWIIDTPESEFSLGECKNCREVKKFRNSFYAPTNMDFRLPNQSWDDVSSDHWNTGSIGSRQRLMISDIVEQLEDESYE